MNRARRQALRATSLVLILAAGPLQAQAAFACEMMDTGPRAECCCDDQQNPRKSPCGDAPMSAHTDCCAESVVLVHDPEARETAPAAQSFAFRSGVDPPQPIALPTISCPQVSRLAAAGGGSWVNGESRSAQRTYLLTQRLRN